MAKMEMALVLGEQFLKSSQGFSPLCLSASVSTL